MTVPRCLLAIGECMIEMSADEGDGASWRMGFAGDTLNTLWYARAGLPDPWRTSYFTRLGGDRLSDRMLGFFESSGIDTRHIARDDDRLPGLYMIELQRGERSFLYWREASAARHLADDEELVAAAIETAGLIYLSGITLAILAADRRGFLIDAMNRARADGRKVAFDPNIRPRLWEDADAIRRTIGAAASAATIILPSFEDEAAAFGDDGPEATATRYLAAGAEEVVVKNGAESIHLASAGETCEIPVAPVREPVDTTAAGDAFNGAYLARRLLGTDMLEAARGASEVARRVVRSHGALVPFDEFDAPR